MIDKKKIKGLLLDFDMTLGNHEKSAYHTIRSILEEHIRDLDPFSYEMEAICQDMLTWNLKGMVKPVRMLELLEEKYGYHIEIDNFNEYWSQRHLEHVELYDGVVDALKELHESYKICVVTDGNTEKQNYKVSVTGVRPLVDAIVTSEECGATKPAPAIYLKALELLDLKAEEVLFVGDRFSSDLLGASRLNIPCLWVWPDDGREAKAPIERIHHFKDLPEWLKV